MKRQEIVRLTEEYGGQWLLSHARRLLRLVSIIGEGLDYNPDIVWIAAHLHDWGACPQWTKKGVPHSIRSKQVAEQYLSKAKCPKAWIGPILEAIEFHHGGGNDRSIEAVLLRDADALDGLGVIGVLGEFAKVPTVVKGDYSTPVGIGMRGACDRAQIRQQNNPALLRLERSRLLAQKRIAQMKMLFTALEEETGGDF